MPDEMMRRRKLAAEAFTERRRELRLTQEQVAQRSDLVVRTVQNFESQGRWPNARTRTRLERAVEWPLGQIDRIASGLDNDGIWDTYLVSAELRALIWTSYPPKVAERLIGVIERALNPGSGSNGAQAQGGPLG